MSEPSAIWSNYLIVFDKTISLTQNVIMSHGRAALSSVIANIDRLHELVACMPGITNAHLHPAIPATLTDICMHQGIASTILFDDSPRRTSENARQYKLRTERIAYIEAKCKNLNLSVLRNRRIRNSLAHVDEYLAKAMSTPNTGWFVDTAVIRRDEFSAPSGLRVGFCRGYISSEDTILHLGNEISLMELRKEASDVLSAVWV